MKEELKKFIKENYVIEKKSTILAKSLFSYNESCSCDYDNANISDFLNNNQNNNDFQSLLFNYIDKRNIKDSDVYNKVHLDRRLFSKIRNDKNYHPSKETIILLGISLELEENEIEKLLESASYSLPKNNYFDLIIRFCFINKIFNLNSINDLLEEYHCKLFSI